MLIRFYTLLLLVLTVLPAHADPSVTTDQRSAVDLEQIGMSFSAVQGGCFGMGSLRGNSDEKPVHEVCVSDYFMGRHEVTQGQWIRIMGENPSRFGRCGDDCPVEQVSWNDAQEFINRLNQLTGRAYRLPTEAEWEYACRNRGKDLTYCGSGDIESFAWYSAVSGNRTHPVGQKQPNGLGLYDMSGNVWEWVLDWKGDYPVATQYNPYGPTASSTRMRRGGSWQYGAAQSRSSWRSSGYPDDRALDVGFRLAHPAVKSSPAVKKYPRQ